MHEERGRRRNSPTTLIKIRDQVLPSESLVDVFDYIGRRELDRWGTVSHEYDAAIQRARPLRNVESVVVNKHLGSGRYNATIFEPTEDGDDEENEVQHSVQVSNSDFKEFVELLFNGLRFCNVTGGVHIAFVKFDCNFVERLKAIKMDFHCEDKRIFLQSVGLEDDVCPLDLLSSFPSFRALNRSTWLLLRSRFRADDVLLKSLTRRGIWDLGDLVNDVDALMQAESITDDGMLDFAFGEYDNDANERHLILNRPSMSPQFMSKLVENYPGCPTVIINHSLVIDITTSFTQQLDIGDFIAYGRRYAMISGLTIWDFNFPDMPDVRIRYIPKEFYANSLIPKCGKLYCWRN